MGCASISVLGSMSPGAPRPGTPGRRAATRRRGRGAGAKVAPLNIRPAFSLPGATRPGTPGRGLLHDSPLRSRVQGPCPMTPEPPHTSCERWEVSLEQSLLPCAHGACRLPKAPPPACLPGRELTGSATLRQWISHPSTARRMGSG